LGSFPDRRPAWLHGFVMVELTGAFRLGGDLDRAYAFGIDAILARISGLASRSPS
jgi:hypothetical protein